MPVSNASWLDLDGSDLTGWTDQDTGEAVSELAPNKPDADPMATTILFDSRTSADTNDKARRSRDHGSLNSVGNRIVISVGLYFDAIGTNAALDRFQMEMGWSSWGIYASFCSDGLFFYTGSHVKIGEWVVQDTWQQKWTFDIDRSGGVGNAVCDIHLNDVPKASGVDCDVDGGYADGLIIIAQYGYATDDRITYLDYLKIGDGFAAVEFIPKIMMP